MRALVVYESMYGNTRDIACAIGAGIAEEMAVEVEEVGTARNRIGPEIGLVVVGGPTHAFSMTRATSREDAATQQPEVEIISQGIGIREWLDRFEAPAGTVFATFDTKIDKPKLPGSAGGAAERRLRRMGYRMLTKPESFWVTAGAGPLADDEDRRATEWGRSLAATVVGATT